MNYRDKEFTLSSLQLTICAVTCTSKYRSITFFSWKDSSHLCYNMYVQLYDVNGELPHLQCYLRSLHCVAVCRRRNYRPPWSGIRWRGGCLWTGGEFDSERCDDSNCPLKSQCEYRWIWMAPDLRMNQRKRDLKPCISDYLQWKVSKVSSDCSLEKQRLDNRVENQRLKP